VKRSTSPVRNALALLFPLAIVACAQLQGLDGYEKVDCVDEDCTPDRTPDSGGGSTVDVNRPDTTPPATCPPCTDGMVCDPKSLKCVECLPGTKECAAGYFCDPDETAGFTCVLGCGTVQDCLVVLGADGGADGDAGAGDAAASGGDAGAGTLACCNNRCVDTAADGKNCGACNVICGSSAACCASNCQDIVSTPTSCGGCGVTCSSNHIPAISCGGKACNGTCETGWADCNTNKLTDGCETNVATDPDKCGGCNIVCSNNHVQLRTCAGGTCNGSCAGTFRDCNNNKQLDGCEIDISTTAAHCGACDNACSNNNIANPTCAAGACNGTCAVGYSDCDNQKLINGCETKTSGLNADPNNCGGCGAAFTCSGNNIPTRTCNGTCTGACAANFGDCNANKLTDGCETRISGAGASVDHCGACNTPCSSLHVPARTCNGTCNGTCEANWSDCNANKQLDGCETRTSVDSMHCGACNAPCGVGNRRCVGGVCQAGTYGVTTPPAAVTFIDACGLTQVAGAPFFNGGTDDEGTGVLTFPNGFTFPFYGTNYTQYSISSNGFIGFGGTAASPNLFGDSCPLPDTNATANVPILFAMNDDLLIRQNFGVCAGLSGTRFVITYRNVNFYPNTADSMTFSVILNPDGTIDIVYQNMDNGVGGAPDTSFSTVGVQNGGAPATQGTSYTCGQNGNLVTGTRIRFYF
jgi:hypothetical protein